MVSLDIIGFGKDVRRVSGVPDAGALSLCRSWRPLLLNTHRPPQSFRHHVMTAYDPCPEALTDF